MQNLEAGRYTDPAIGWQGWVEPVDRTWIMFIDADNRPVMFLDRDPATGGVLSRCDTCGNLG